MFTNDWIIYVLVFGTVLLTVQGVYWLIVRTRTEKKAINRRLELGASLAPAEVLETLRRERGLSGSGKAFPLGVDALVVQSGLKVDPTRLLIWIVIFAVALFFALGAIGIDLVLAVIMSPVIALGCVYLFLVYARRKRISRFGEQLPDSIDVIVRGLRAGHPFRVALGLVSREMQDPIGTEFGIVADEVTFGLDLNAAVDNLTRRVGHEDLSFFAVSINIQSQTGGNLAEILARLSQLVRNRARLRLKVRALTSEGRISAIFLTFAPFIMFLIITLISPDYFWDVREHPIILPALVVALLMIGTGNFIMYRMVHFKF
jgi:tight adherence protein B